MELRPERMAAALNDAMLATDLADYMVKRGVPFREAHHTVGQAVRLAEDRACGLTDLTLDDYRGIWPGFDAALFDVLSFEGSVETHTARGGTARAAVEAQIALAREKLSG
jgi:argininosuccinate lyase